MRTQVCPRTIVGLLAVCCLTASTAFGQADSPVKPPPGVGPQQGQRPRGPGGPGGPFGRRPTFDFKTQAKDANEQKALAAIDAIFREQGRRMNVPHADGRLLRIMAEALNAKTVVEFGTSNGISAIWMAIALRKTGGRLITHEIDPATAATARANFERAGVADLITVVEGDGHVKAAELKGPIDMVFIDADKEGYVDYLQKTLPLVRPGGLIFAHNIDARMATPEFVKAISTSADLDSVVYSDGGGMSISVKKR